MLVAKPRMATFAAVDIIFIYVLYINVCPEAILSIMQQKQLGNTAREKVQVRHQKATEVL